MFVLLMLALPLAGVAALITPFIGKADLVQEKHW